MERPSRLAAGSLVLIMLACGQARGGTKALWQMVQAVRRPPGGPLAADVIMRSLTLHPASPADHHDTWKAIHDFHVTRLEWSYITDKAFIARVVNSGRVFGGAASAPSYIPKAQTPDWYDKVVIKDLLGRPIVAPWKRTWKRTLWGCVNNPEYRRGHLAFLKRYIDAGAQVMQRDEPRANLLATDWGGCFCDHCMTLFRQWLAARLTSKQRAALELDDLANFDYREFLKQRKAPAGDAFGRWKGDELKRLFIKFQHDATVGFHRQVRREIEAYARRGVPFSCNNGASRTGDIEMLFDWWFGELSYSAANPRSLLSIFRNAAAHHKLQVVTMPKKGDYRGLAEWQRRTRQTIATAYACGGFCMVPWDVYMPNNAPRYFGKPEQYADLFAFVRANRRLLEDYWEAAVAGPGITDERYKQPPVEVAGGTGQLMAVVTAKAGDRAAPIVIHLIEWGARGQPFVLKLRRTYFGGRRRRSYELLTPAPYDREAHRQAERSGDFSPLCLRRRLAAREVGIVQLLNVPPLDPWGILVVR